jgi:hypothetical protein
MNDVTGDRPASSQGFRPTAARTIALVGSAAGGLEHLRAQLVEPLVAAGHTVAVSLTPTAATWLDHLGEIRLLDAITGLPVRSAPRLPGEARPHPTVVFPRVNAAHARHPAWESHLARLRRAGVELLYGEQFWPLAEPRSAADSRPLPWAGILAALTRTSGTSPEGRSAG